MYHVYTFGRKSIQFLVMTPEKARLMNKFTNAFFEAQEHFLKKTGRRWTPDDTIPFNRNSWTDEDIVEYNKLVRKLNRQHALRNKMFDLLRIDVSDDKMDDYLIKRF